MYASATAIDVQQGKVDEFAHAFEANVVPTIRNFLGFYLLLNPETGKLYEIRAHF